MGHKRHKGLGLEEDEPVPAIRSGYIRKIQSLRSVLGDYF